jgi:beta-galactosidase
MPCTRVLISFRAASLLLAIVVLCTLRQATAAEPYRTPHAPLPGSAWYPKQWPESRWDTDLTLMEQAHMNVVRIGEFAWSAMEPGEGHFELDWMNCAITLAAKHHIAVVLGTPTDAPPAWLTTKYPETLGVNADGQTRQHGGRRQFNYASPKYRELCRRIVGEMARRFGHNTNVIGWQIGNEYTDESFDPATRAQFDEFLHAKYKTLYELNRRWATAYW